MADIDLELRMRLMRARPELSLSHADSLIRGIASSCLEVRDDAIARGEIEHEDFVTFCHVDDVALAAIFRKTAVEFFVFAADESFIHAAEHLMMTEVQKFFQLARSRCDAPDEALVFAISQALPWMEEHRRAEKDEESENLA
ncbi:hypothetical protein [Chthoniobacter flavus]|uniref:hypothetical protein n=1 Tax=Chthoniobacter flavus TaxID=191863 RepID=UPI0010451520|nr:hypothetical protein [Chthoniobacter flavus]